MNNTHDTNGAGIKVEKKTSTDWEKEQNDFMIMDADGWDRKNYQYSFCEELITKEEFNKRLIGSTLIFKKQAEKRFYDNQAGGSSLCQST